MGTAYDTSSTLLRRLASDPVDQAAWDDFVERYGRLIFAWCRRWNLQPADAEDVTQTVLLQLARQMRTFQYDRNGSFRAFLRTVARRGWNRFLEHRRRPGQGAADATLDRLLESVAAREDFLQRFAAEGDRELLELASERVRGRVRPNTWEAFRLTAVEGLSGAEVGQRLGMTPGAVFVARSKVIRQIRDEVHRLDPEFPHEAHA